MRPGQLPRVLPALPNPGSLSRRSLMSPISGGRRKSGRAGAVTMTYTSGDGGPGVIRSEFADDPDMIELVEEFAASMPSRIEAIESLRAAGDLSGLIHLSHQLKGAGGGYGFAPISEVAARAEESLRSLDAPEQLESVRREIEELVDICQRVRA